MMAPEFRRLVEAAQALLDENTEVALNSFHGDGPWSDAMWARGDERNALLCIELRRALHAVRPTQPSPKPPFRNISPGPPTPPQPRKWEGPGSRAEIEDYEAGK